MVLWIPTRKIAPLVKTHVWQPTMAGNNIGLIKRAVMEEDAPKMLP
jgi:hypothetical protein